MRWAGEHTSNLFNKTLSVNILATLTLETDIGLVLKVGRLVGTIYNTTN